MGPESSTDLLSVLCHSAAQVSHTLLGSSRTSVQWVKGYPTVLDSLREPHGPVTKPNRLTFFRVTGVSENSHGCLPAPQELRGDLSVPHQPWDQAVADNPGPKESTLSSRVRNEVGRSAGLREKSGRTSWRSQLCPMVGKGWAVTSGWRTGLPSTGPWA